MKPKETVKSFVDLFNGRDLNGLAELYHDDAVNHQVANEPIRGKRAIKEIFERKFALAGMVCIVENIFEDGEWVI